MSAGFMAIGGMACAVGMACMDGWNCAAGWSCAGWPGCIAVVGVAASSGSAKICWGLSGGMVMVGICWRPDHTGSSIARVAAVSADDDGSITAVAPVMSASSVGKAVVGCGCMGMVRPTLTVESNGMVEAGRTDVGCGRNDSVASVPTGMVGGIGGVRRDIGAVRSLPGA